MHKCNYISFYDLSILKNKNILIAFLIFLQPSVSENPKILEPGPFTKAAPFKERKYARKVSDTIANNYSPGARHLTTSILYQETKGGK